MDFDMECLRPFDPLLQHGILVARMDNDMSGASPGMEHSMPNSWLASHPKHPFWLFALQKMHIVAKIRPAVSVEKMGGSIFFHNIYHAWLQDPHAYKSPAIQFVPRSLIYPYDWRTQDDMSIYCSAQNDGFNTTKCKELVATMADGDHVFTISYFTKLWGNWMMLEKISKD
jgi:hypothetical protein